MKKNFKLFGWLIFIIGALEMSSCEDTCTTEYIYYTYQPVYLQREDILATVRSSSPIALQNPGKIYYKDGFIYINEAKKGVHVIDNRDPSSPQNIAFLNIPGNYDIAIRNNILYADCFVDLLAIDISDPLNISVKEKVLNVLPVSANFEYSYDESNGLITSYELTKVTGVRDCDDNRYYGGCRNCEFLNFSSDANKQASIAPGNSDGKAGSMARFALYNNYLYAISGAKMQLLDISTPDAPKKGNTIDVEWGIETLFPYRDKLFIGSQDGLFIYDNKNPSMPEKLSKLAHVRSCDPVVVDDQYAYVTLRNGNTCGGFTNQLDVIDLADLRAPKLLKSYPMENPYGLGKDNNTLFICDGKFGLKVYNTEKIMEIDQHQLAHYKNIDSYDVIPLDGTLLMIGKDGLYQYDYSNPAMIKLLSVIPITKE